MSRRHIFHPTPTPFSRLEDRIALSHAIAAAEVASVSQVTDVVRGTITTRLPTPFLLGAGYHAELVGSAAASMYGPTHVSIELRSNGSLPPQYSGARGTMIVRSASRNKPGEMTIALGNGPVSRLESGTLDLSFATEDATGVFRSAAGSTGTYELMIVPSEPPQDGIARGTFRLVQTS